MNKRPFLSIAIPTRQRHETLFYTLQTILNQDFDDYEIIVSDNNSSKETKDIVDTFASNKIKYIRSDTDLSLCDSWEQAVSSASGEYIMGIADNDGIIEGGLSFLVNLIKLNKNPPLINFVKNTYNWPCLDETQNNVLYLHKTPSLEIIDGISLIQTVLDDNRNFYKLPMIYNSIVHSNLINKMKIHTGKIFNSVTPDVYSGFCLAYLGKEYLVLKQPISIAGNSAKSLGVNYANNNGEIIQKETKAREKSEIQFHPLIPCVISHSAAIADAYLRAEQTLNMSGFNYSRRKMIKETIADLHVFDEESLENSIEKIIESCKDNTDLYNFAKQMLQENYPKLATNKQKRIKKFGFNNDKLCLNGVDFRLANIFEVSQFMSRFYDYTLHVINYPLVQDDFSNLKKDAKIAIWGNGQYGKDLQNSIKSLRTDLEVAFIIDSFKESLDSKPIVVTPDKIYNVDYIIIASMFVLEIANTIQGLDFDKSIKVLKYAKGMW